MVCPPPGFTVCPAPPGTQSAIPSIPPCVPSYPVNPCQPDPARNTGPCECVCVPTVEQGTPTLIAPVPPRTCKYIQPEKPKSYAPNRQYKPPDLEMSDSTTYRKSYLPVANEKNPQFRPDDNLCVGEGPFSQDTVNKMSYKVHKDVLPPCLVRPCQHKLLGEGPFQDITTNKHDYVPKPLQKQNKVAPPLPNLYSSECPLSDKTTNRLSYMPVDMSNVRVAQLRPLPAIEKAEGPFEQNTVHKMSFMPWEPQGPIDKPWAIKQRFRPPTLRMSTNTINRLSYGPPGTYKECDPSDPDAIPCPEECDPNPPSGECCQPCCCPKAAC